MVREHTLKMVPERVETPSTSGGIPNADPVITEELGVVQKLLPKQLPPRFLDELTCPICMDFFDAPITLPCGHTYCRFCIAYGVSTKKLCPLCRQAVGPTMCVNTVISSLIDQLGLKPKHERVKSSHGCSWWPEELKFAAAVPLFLRILAMKMNLDPALMDSLIACVLDLFQKSNMWSSSRWVMTPDDFELLVGLIGFDHNDWPGSLLRLKDWMAQYIMYCPMVRSPTEELKATIIVIADRVERVNGAVLKLANSQQALPWDCGRHNQSVIYLPHFTVSKSHLVFVRCGEQQLGIIDCGSTVGTMIKLSDVAILKDGDTLSLSGRVPVLVTLSRYMPSSPYQLAGWSRSRKTVVSAEEIKLKMRELGISEDYATNQKMEDFDSVEASEKTPSVNNTTNGINHSSTIGDEAAPRTEKLSDASAEPPAVKRVFWELFPDLEPIQPLLCIKYTADTEQTSSLHIDPGGTILGRGILETSKYVGYSKVMLPISDGHVSREHCIFTYNGAQPEARRWTVENIGLLGTFLQIQPYKAPYPLENASVVKVGHCRFDLHYGEVEAAHENNS